MAGTGSLTGVEVAAYTVPTAPQLHAPVACAVPNLRHVEWFADHVRLERLLFDGVTEPVAGALPAQLDRPGHGLVFRDSDAATYRCGS